MLKITCINTFIARTLLLVSLLVALSPTNSAFAAEPVVNHQKHKVVSRQTNTTKTDTGYTRAITKTDDMGATANRRTDVLVNKEEGSRTRNTSGNTFEGKTYNGQSTAHKTDTGYVSQGQFTNSEGKIVDRSVTAIVDKKTGTVTKGISVTPQGGETKTKILVRPLKRNT